MICEALAIPGVVQVVPQKWEDDRGYFCELFRKDWFNQNVSDVELIQENQSLSRQAGTIRGLHFQTMPFTQGKLVRCQAGALVDVVVDIRRGSPTFGHWLAVELSQENGRQLWVPPGTAHGFCTLLPNTVISYKVSAYYSPAHDRGMAWDDPDIAISWPAVADPAFLSPKDRLHPRLAELPAFFTYGDR